MALTMLLDITPYKFWKKKIDPANMSDAEIATSLSDANFVRAHLGGYASQVAHAAYFTFPVVGMIALAFTGIAAPTAIPLFSAIGAAYAVYKTGSILLQKGVVRAVNDKGALEAEQEVREVKRAAQARQMAAEEQVRKIKEIRDRELKAKEAFNAAIDAGLPLQEAIQVRKSPLSLKPTTRRDFLTFRG